MRNGKRQLVALLAGAALLVGACGGGSGGGSSSDGPVEKGGDLVVGRFGSIVGWLGDDCYSAATNQTLPMVYGTLLDWTDDAQGTKPGLAESVVYDDSALTYTVTLREGLKFSDGSDLTSADVLFSVDQWKAGVVNGGFFANVTSATAPDDLTVVMQLAAPDTFFEPLLSWCVTSVYPEDFGGKTMDEFKLAPVGAGPYMLAAWNNPGASEEIVLERNPYYWEEGKPLLDSITLRSNSDPNQRLLAYEAGDLDMIELLENEIKGQVPDDEIVSGANMAILYVLTNTRVKGLDDIKVRQAIAAAIDRESLTALFDGTAQVAEGILPNNVPFGGKPTTPFTHDVERAKALMAESSLADGGSFELLVDPSRQPVAEAIAAQLAEIGLDITVAVVDNGTLFSRAASGDYELQINGNVATSPTALDPIIATQVIDWYFTGIPAETGLDEIMAAMASGDDAEREALVTKIQDALIEQAGMIGLVTLDSLYAVKPNVANFAPFPFLRWYPQDVGKRS